MVKDNLYIGFQGVSGSFSEQALFQYFGEDIKTYAVKQFEDLFLELEKDTINYAVLPIENSSTGAITQVYDLLNKYECYIVGETCIKVEHNLLGIKGSTIDDIREVYSHTQAFEQSKGFLNSHPKWKLTPYYNTAKSALYIKNNNNKFMAAIASKKAADIYNLEILADNINCNSTNTTRFVIIGKELDGNEGYNKISVILSTAHKAGSLYYVLRHFAENNINMLKIESRPIQNEPWKYFFYIDFEGNLKDENVKDAVEHMKKDSNYFKLLGNYKKYDI